MISSGNPSRCPGMRLVKVGAGGCGEGVILSDHVVWVYQHWFRRALLCLREACPACDYNGSREVGFLALSSATSTRLLVEVSPSSFERLAGLVALDGEQRRTPLRGVRVQISRRSHRSPLILEPVCKVMEGVDREPSLQEIGSAVMRLYGLPPMRAEEALAAYADRVREGYTSVVTAAVASELERVALAGRSSR